MKSKRIFAIYCMTLFIAWIIGLIFYQKKEKENYIIFLNSEIKGILTKINKNKSYTEFYVSNNKQKFSFIPIENPLNHNTYFSEFALPGDSIIKSAKSDTLRLIHHGKIYLYLFEKIN